MGIIKIIEFMLSLISADAASPLFMEHVANYNLNFPT